MLATSGLSGEWGGGFSEQECRKGWNKNNSSDIRRFLDVEGGRRQIISLIDRVEELCTLQQYKKEKNEKKENA